MFIKKKSIFVNGVGLDNTYANNQNIRKLNRGKINIGVLSAYRVNKGYNQIIEVAYLLKDNNKFQFTCYGYDDFSKFKKKCDDYNL